jgi:hypothetical protein
MTFAIAHEIGHFQPHNIFISEHEHWTFSDQLQMKAHPSELDANEFARHVLGIQNNPHGYEHYGEESH